MLQALRQVVVGEPELGLALMQLARLCLVNHSFELTSLATPIEEAITCARRAVQARAGQPRVSVQ